VEASVEEAEAEIAEVFDPTTATVAVPTATVVDLREEKISMEEVAVAVAAAAGAVEEEAGASLRFHEIVIPPRDGKTRMVW